MSIFISFDFYGAGNVGDDLMLAGFLSAYGGKKPLSCLISRNVASQRIRFPQVTWREDTNHRTEIIQESECLLGIGDTPFQMSSGEWLLKKLLADAQVAAGKKIPCLMIGVGAESEVRTRPDLMKKILGQIDRIWTRDEFTSEILVKDCGFPAERLSTGGDLANIVLSTLFASDAPTPAKDIDLGLCYYDERINRGDIVVLRNFVREYSRDNSIQFFANETREEKDFEPQTYRKITGGFRRLIGKQKMTFFAPDYQKGTLPDLVNHYAGYRTVLSSRYHALLTAAWAGCRVVGHGRSSKLSALTHELGIPLVENPITVSKLNEAVDKACVVDRGKLEEMSRRAGKAVAELQATMDEGLQ